MSEVTTVSTDVVVVGGGGAGLAAAYESACQGAQVTVIEKQPQLGGSTGIAVGSFTAACTSLQRAAGIADSPDWHDEDMAAFAGPREVRNDGPMRRYFAQHAGETLEWLKGMGLAFHGPTAEPPNRVARMHNVIPNAKAYIAVLHRQLLRRRVRILLNHRVERLVRDDSRRVRGVEVAGPDGVRRRILAGRAVVLATGDYAGGEQVKREYLPARIARIEAINPDATGDGHLMGRDAGAELINMDLIYGPELRFVPPPKKPFSQLLPGNPLLARALALGMRVLPRAVINHMIKGLLVTWQHPENSLFQKGAILVNAHGRRFTDETANPELAVPDQPGQQAHILLDHNLATTFSAWPNYISTAPDIAYAYLQDYRSRRADIFAQAPTLEGLAGRIGVPAGPLTASVDAFNRAQAAGRPGAFGRRGSGAGLTGPPFYALGPLKSWIVNADGGLRVNRRMEALDTTGSVIPGLYAAGCVGIGGVVLWGHGLHIAWAFTSGRLAGRYAAGGEDPRGPDTHTHRTEGTHG